MVSGLWMMAHLGAQTGGDDLFWPQIVRGFGTVVLMFLPLQLAALRLRAEGGGRLGDPASST